MCFNPLRLLIVLKPLNYLSPLIRFFKLLNPLNCYWHQFLQSYCLNIFLHMLLHTDTHAQPGDRRHKTEDVRQTGEVRQTWNSWHKTGDVRQGTQDVRQEIVDMRQGTGDMRQETWDRRRDKGDRRIKTGDKRCEKGDRRREKGDIRSEKGDRRSEKGDILVRHFDVRWDGSMASYPENLGLLL